MTEIEELEALADKWAKILVDATRTRRSAEAVIDRATDGYLKTLALLDAARSEAA